MNRYVAVEGIDGAGKSTVARDLAAALRDRGHAVTTVREPGGTAAGEAIRQIVLGGSAGRLEDWTEALLFAAARAELAAAVVAPALQRGEVVVSDRCYYSSLAYQGAGRGLGVETVRLVNEAGLCGVVPGTILLLRIEPERGFAREDEHDRISSAGVELQQTVAAAYDALAAAEPDRFLVMDASRSVADLVAEVVPALERRW